MGTMTLVKPSGWDAALKDGAPVVVADGVEISLPRHIAVEMVRATSEYNAFAQQYNRVAKSDKLTGTAARLTLEAERRRVGSVLRAADSAVQEYIMEEVSARLAVMSAVPLTEAEGTEGAEGAEEDGGAGREREAQELLESCLNAADENYQKKLFDFVESGLFTAVEHDAVAERTYAQSRKEQYKQTIQEAEEAKLEAKRDLGEDVKAGRISHADYFAAVGEEYTVAAGEKVEEEP